MLPLDDIARAKHEHDTRCERPEQAIPRSAPPRRCAATRILRFRGVCLGRAAGHRERLTGASRCRALHAAHQLLFQVRGRFHGRKSKRETAEHPLQLFQLPAAGGTRGEVGAHASSFPVVETAEGEILKCVAVGMIVAHLLCIRGLPRPYTYTHGRGKGIVTCSPPQACRAASAARRASSFSPCPEGRRAARQSPGA